MANADDSGANELTVEMLKLEMEALNQRHEEEQTAIHDLQRERGDRINELQRMARERLHFTLKYLAPLATAIVIGTFTWAWSVNGTLTHLQSRLNSLDVGDRYTGQRAERDQARLTAERARMKQELLGRIERLEAKFFAEE